MPVLPELEVWGGVESTHNRVGDDYFNQLERSGHLTRLSDLDRFAQLGLQAIRYPVLWEHVAPNGLEQADWRWADERLTRLRELGLEPIVGLVHHGSGPRPTSLIDPAFPAGLAAFARAVAARYPWVRRFTPVNEPLTTARFSGLYGHWYPHGRDDRTFIRALVTECRATILAMAAIREVNPHAELIQTEDIGKTWSTPRLQYQAEFENERRWLGLDLLLGRVDKRHPLWQYLERSGMSKAERDWFRKHPCPPGIIGVNHYLSGERFLDERMEHYPEHSHGGNGLDAYADELAHWVQGVGVAGPAGVLAEVWERYRRPIAITEAQNGSTRDEQLRWLWDVWQGATTVRQAGADVRAVTFWSLLGAFDWNQLVTCRGDFYEPGAFDVRAPEPRATAVAGFIKQLGAGKTPDHPVLAGPGWWRRPDRIRFRPDDQAGNSAPALVPAPAASPRVDSEPGAARPILISGAAGTLGQAFARICTRRGLSHRLLTHAELEITDPASVEAALRDLNPWAVVNASGYVRVDEAEREPASCLRANTVGPTVLAAACATRAVPLLTFSSDLVFDGSKQSPYVESDPVAPLNVYGRSKAMAEEAVLAVHSGALVVRTSAFFGPWDDYNFVTLTLRALAAGETVRAATDEVVSPTYVPDLVDAALDLLIDGERGIWHLANQGAASWLELGRRAAERAGLPAERIVGCTGAELGYLAPRPRYSVLGSERGWIMPSLDDALDRYLQERAA